MRSKLQIFDHTKRPQRSRLFEHQKPGHVKAKLAIFDSKLSSSTSRSTMNTVPSNKSEIAGRNIERAFSSEGQSGNTKKLVSKAAARKNS